MVGSVHSRLLSAKNQALNFAGKNQNLWRRSDNHCCVYNPKTVRTPSSTRNMRWASHPAHPLSQERVPPPREGLGNVDDGIPGRPVSSAVTASGASRKPKVCGQHDHDDRLNPAARKSSDWRTEAPAAGSLGADPPGSGRSARRVFAALHRHSSWGSVPAIWAYTNASSSTRSVLRHRRR